MSTNPFQKPASNDNFAINLEGVQDGYHIEPGQYPAILTDIEQAVSKSSGNPMWVLTFSIVEGEYAGTKLSDWKMYCSLKQNALFKLKRVLTALGFQTGADAEFRVEFEKDEALGRRVLLDVEDRQNQDGELGSQIKNVYPHPDGPFDSYSDGEYDNEEFTSTDDAADTADTASNDPEPTEDETDDAESSDTPPADDGEEEDYTEEEFTGEDEIPIETPTPEPPKAPPTKPARPKPTLK